MKKLALLLLLISGLANATDYYFANCDAGADPACVAGSDANSGLSSSLPKKTFSAFDTIWQAAHAGDRLLLAKGSAWTNWNLASKAVTDSLASYQANPLVVDSYSPTTYSSTAQPLVVPPSGCADYNTSACGAFYWTSTNGWGTTRWGGYTIRNIHIDGASAALTVALGVNRTVESVIFENLTVSNIGLFFGCGGDQTYGKSKNIIVRNSTLSYGADNGFSGNNCDNVTIENNAIDHAAYAAKIYTDKFRDHAIYFSGNNFANGTSYDSGIVIRNNTITNTCLGTTDIVGADVMCGCSIIVAHDRLQNWTLENNYIMQAVNKDDAFCQGIQYKAGNGGENEWEKYITIRSNRIINSGSAGIILENCDTCLVENNVIVKETVIDNYEGIRSLTNGFPIPPAGSNNKLTVRNNSVFIQQATDTTTGIGVGGQGSGHIVVSNMVLYGSGGPGPFGYCFAADLSAGSYTWDNNLCYNFAGWTSAYATKAAFSAARSGADANGVSGDPVLVATPASGNGFSMQIQTSSPAKNAGNSTLSAPRALYSYPKIGVRDIGAYEFGSNP